MNRRKAIGNIVMAGLGAGLAWSGYKWYDWNKTPDLNYLQQKTGLIAELAETILPATPGIPGAKEAQVGEFIVVMIRDVTDRMSANKFIDGLKDLVRYCDSNYHRSFESCTPSEKNAVLSHFQQKGRPFKGILGKAQNRYLGRSFFSTLKGYTVEGYCTSEAGATKGLSYVMIPGAWHGCIPMTKDQRSWATR